MRRTPAVALVYTALLAAALALAACDAIEDKIVRREPGERLYRRLCSDCHGLDGRGNTALSMGKDYANIIDDIAKYGIDTGTMENLVRDGIFAEMPAHPELTSQEVRQIVDHVLKLRGTSRRPG
jgi:cytochrome c oxidase cbb3-type subunit III